MRKLFVILLAISVVLMLAVPAMALEFNWSSKNTNSTSATGVTAAGQQQNLGGSSGAAGNAALTQNCNTSNALAVGGALAGNNTGNTTGNAGLACSAGGGSAALQGSGNCVGASSEAEAVGAGPGCRRSLEVNICSKNTNADSGTGVTAMNTNLAGSGNSQAIGNDTGTFNTNDSCAGASLLAAAGNNTENTTTNMGMAASSSGDCMTGQLANNTVIASSAAGAFAD